MFPCLPSTHSTIRIVVCTQTRGGSLSQARSEFESFLKEQPENHILLGDLALTNMSLGDKAAALSLSERGITVNPTEKDAVVGPAAIEFFARVATQTGEADQAIAAL